MKNRSALISFYAGKDVDNQSRLFNEILNWNYDLLESVHDFIQWLFPLDVSSAYNGNAPILKKEDIDTFRNSPELQGNVLKAFMLMLEFYGFVLKEGQVVKSDRFQERAKNWLNCGNHNMLRITRILKSLSLLGMNDYAIIFFAALKSVYEDHPDLIGNSYRYWKNAMVFEPSSCL